MNYKQLRRVLRERLDAPGSQGDDDQRPEEEHHPVAVQELPVQDLPVNVADLTGEELVAPPVNDAEFLPGNLQQLQQAASVLVQQVPPLQIQDFYHRLRRLIGTVIRQQNMAGENDAELSQEPGVGQSIERADNPDEPDSAESATPEVSEAAKRIRRVVRQQVTEHRVRKAVRQVLVEQSSQQEILDGFNREGLDYRDPWNDFRMMNPWIIRRLSEKPMEEIQAMHAEFESADDSRADDIVRDVQRAYLPGAIGALRKLGPPFWTDAHEAAYKGSKDRAATGKTGSESELLKKISEQLKAEGVKMGVSAIRNVLGRFNENLGIRYFFDNKGVVIPEKKSTYEKLLPLLVMSFNQLFRTGVKSFVFTSLYNGDLSVEPYQDKSQSQNEMVLRELYDAFGLEFMDNESFAELSKRIFSEVLLGGFEDVKLKPGAGGYVGLPSATDKSRRAEYETEFGAENVPAKQSEYTKLEEENPEIILRNAKKINVRLKEFEDDVSRLLRTFTKDAADGYIKQTEDVVETFEGNEMAREVLETVGQAFKKHQKHAEKLKK